MADSLEDEGELAEAEVFEDQDQLTGPEEEPAEGMGLHSFEQVA